MKKIFLLVFAFALLLAVQPPPLSAAPDDPGTSIVLQDDLAPAAMAQETGGVAVEPTATGEPEVAPTEIGNFFAENWGALIGIFLITFEAIARLTRTEKDNSIVNLILTLYNSIFPNLKKGGGTFQVSSK